MLYALSKMRNQLNIFFPIVVPSQFVIFFFLIDKHIFDEGIEQGGIHFFFFLYAGVYRKQFLVLFGMS